MADVRRLTGGWAGPGARADDGDLGGLAAGREGARAVGRGYAGSKASAARWSLEPEDHQLGWGGAGGRDGRRLGGGVEVGEDGVDGVGRGGGGEDLHAAGAAGHASRSSRKTRRNSSAQGSRDGRRDGGAAADEPAGRQGAERGAGGVGDHGGSAVVVVARVVVAVATVEQLTDAPGRPAGRGVGRRPPSRHQRQRGHHHPRLRAGATWS